MTIWWRSVSSCIFCPPLDLIDWLASSLRVFVLLNDLWSSIGTTNFAREEKKLVYKPRKIASIAQRQPCPPSRSNQEFHSK
jgi:hypothetical protein